jgi:glycosyltransferase involved in cell wall biosynthesis
MYKINILFCFIAKIINIKLLCIEHNTFSQKNKIQTFKKALLSYIYSGAFKIANVSIGAKNDFDKVFPKLKPKSILLYNPIIDEYTSTQIKKINNSRNAETDVVTIANIGSLTWQKNQEEFIKIIGLLKKKYTLNVKGIIAGDGPRLHELSKIVEFEGLTDSIKFTGFVQNSEQIYSHCDLFLLTSRYEGLPTVILEAMRAGCEIVSSNCDSGPRELLVSDNNWRLYEPGSIDAAARAIIKALKSNNNRLDCFKMYEPVLAKFSIKKATQQYLIELDI